MLISQDLVCTYRRRTLRLHRWCASAQAWREELARAASEYLQQHPLTDDVQFVSEAAPEVRKQSAAERLKERMEKRLEREVRARGSAREGRDGMHLYATRVFGHCVRCTRHHGSAHG